MIATFPELRIGDPLRHKALSVFPLFSDSEGGIEYRLGSEALADESATVKEVNEGGSVPHLLVENRGDIRILFIEGEELVGAKQNRILNTSVLIAPRSKVKIPVSCVEQGRWTYKTRGFKSSGANSPTSIRYALKKSVGNSARSGLGHRSDQGKVWRQVESCLAAHNLDSETSAMSKAFEGTKEKSSIYRKKTRYVEGATGMAIAIGGKIVAIDVFDKPSTCAKMWDRLMSGCILDALTAGEEARQANCADVERLLGSTSEAEWKRVKPVDEGEEFRAEFDKDHASMLSLENSVVHGSVASLN